MIGVSPARTLSVIVPALNEEQNLPGALETIVGAIGDRFADYELLIFDDGSTDRTEHIADELAARDPHIRVFHNARNFGMGYNYNRGIELARMEYVTWFPGDNDAPVPFRQAPTLVKKDNSDAIKLRRSEIHD